MNVISLEVLGAKGPCNIFETLDTPTLKRFITKNDSSLIYPRVYCQMKTHPMGNDRFDHVEEIVLLKRAVSLAYPYLPEELQEIAPQVFYVVNHRAVGLTKQFMGFSAEDDPEYNYYHGKEAFERDPRNTGKQFKGDTEFYPEGTIKVNVTEKFIQVLKLCKILMMQTDDPVLLRGLQAGILALIAHELKHVLQYHTHPVRDLGRFPDLVVDGLAPLDLLDEARIKIQYELDAADLDRTYLDKESLLAYADAFDSYERAHPNEFEPNGRFSLLSSKLPKPYKEYYLIQASRVVHLRQQFSKVARISYYSQTIPPEKVHDLIALKMSIQNAIHSGAISQSQVASFLGKLGNITKQWNEFMKGANREFLFSKEEYRIFLEGVEKRFIRERDEVRVLLAQVR